MENCLFCKIAGGKLNSETVFEDKNFKVFKDAHPKAPVHLLLIPKKHIQSIAQLCPKDENIVAQMIYTAKKIASEEKLSGYKLVFNVGRDGGQVIDHLHLHILGGWNGKETFKNLNI